MTSTPSLCSDADPMVADIVLDALSRHVAVDREPHPAAGARELLGDAHADPVAAPVGDHHRGADIDLVAQHLPGVDDMARSRRPRSPAGAAGRRWRRSPRRASPLAHQRGVDRGLLVTTSTPASSISRVEIGDDAAELGAARQQLRQQGLAAEPRRRPRRASPHGRARRRRPPPSCRPGRRRRPARACAAAAGLRLAIASARARSRDAGCRRSDSPAWKWPMQAWLQAMQARMSSSRPAAGLGRHLGIADHRPGHAAHVGLARRRAPARRSAAG